MSDTPTHRDLDILLCCWGDCEADRGRCCATEIADARRAALTAAGYVVEQGWQPIETAPRDRMLMTGHVEDGAPIIGYYHLGYWREHNGKGTVIKPTHWRPLPAGPTGAPA